MLGTPNWEAGSPGGIGNMLTNNHQMTANVMNLKKRSLDPVAVACGATLRLCRHGNSGKQNPGQTTLPLTRAAETQKLRRRSSPRASLAFPASARVLIALTKQDDAVAREAPMQSPVANRQCATKATCQIGCSARVGEPNAFQNVYRKVSVGSGEPAPRTEGEEGCGVDAGTPRGEPRMDGEFAGLCDELAVMLA